MSAGADARLPVSVVIPAFDSAATLERALDSVAAQSRIPAEVIVVDDASRDGTAELLTRLAAVPRPFRLRAVRQAHNGGAATARNAGWTLAQEEYVAFLDADDAWHPRKLEIQHRWMAAHPQLALCGHRCAVVADPAPISAPLPDGEPPVRRCGLASFLLANRLSTPTVMLRRTIEQRFADGKRYAEDYLLWMQIVAAHGAADLIDLPLAYLFKARYGEGGLSSHLWASQRGELDTLARLRRDGTLGGPGWAAATAWSWLKFLRRTLFARPGRSAR